MLNSKQMKLATKAVQALTRIDSPVVFTVKGIIQDIKSHAYGPHEMLVPIWGAEGTVSAITADENWSNDPQILDHLIAAVQGRMAHFHILESTGVDVTQASMEQTIELMAHSDEQQGRVLQQLVGIMVYTAYKQEVEANEAMVEALLTNPVVH